MSLLVRKIDRALWLQNNIMKGADVSGDAITSCMRTTKNTLSTWQIPSEDRVDDAVLAIISTGQHLETIDVVILDSDVLASQGIAAVRQQTEVPITDLKDTHFNLIDLTYPKLGAIADSIVQRFKSDEVKRYTESRIAKVFQEAIEKKRVEKDKLPNHVTRKLP